MDQNTLLGVLISVCRYDSRSSSRLFLKNELKPIIQKRFWIRIGGDGGGVGLVTFNSVDEYVRSDGASGISAASIGFMVGIPDAAFADRVIPHLHLGSDEPEGHVCGLKEDDDAGSGGHTSQYPGGHGGRSGIC